jgi:hypothetical protein
MGVGCDRGSRLGDAMEITLPDQIKLYFDKAGLGDPDSDEKKAYEAIGTLINFEVAKEVESRADADQ